MKILAGMFVLILGGTVARAMPAQVVIIRHGEKPPFGNEVDTQGCERAYSLPSFLLRNPTVVRFGAPVALYAQQPGKESGSLRPIQTLAPTSSVAGLPILNQFTRDDFQPMVRQIETASAFNGRTVIIAWEHNRIPDLATAFGLQLQAETSSWPADVFDEAWVLNFEGTTTLQIVPEYVLPSDNPYGGLAQWSQPPPATGRGPALSSQIITACATNASLDGIVRRVIQAPLP